MYAIHAGDTVYVDSYCEGEKEHREYLMKTVGEHSFSVDFTNGSAQTHFTVTFSGTDKMFIDDIFVKQILRAGESYTSALASFEVEGIDNTSYTFTDLTGSESDSLEELKARYGIELDLDCPVEQLSISMQQKIEILKMLYTGADILILDEPTRGIDVGAKYEIYTLMNRLVEEGMSIIMISSELPEVLGMSDRLYVMSGGSITGELSAEEADERKVMAMAVRS